MVTPSTSLDNIPEADLTDTSAKSSNQAFIHALCIDTINHDIQNKTIKVLIKNGSASSCCDLNN